MTKLFDNEVAKYDEAEASVPTAPTLDVIISEEAEVDVHTVTSDESINAG